MKIYVAGKTDDWPRVRTVQQFCEKLGHQITFDWTKTVEELGAVLDPNEHEFRRECAYNDLIGVQQADAFIMLTYSGLCGTLIEFGMAVAQNLPVVVIGEPERNSVFFALDNVKMAPAKTSGDLTLLSEYITWCGTFLIGAITG